MHTIQLTNYIIKLYVNDLFDINILSNEYFINILNSQIYPRGILEQIETVGNLLRIQIYDLNNNLILNSEYAIIE